MSENREPQYLELDENEDFRLTAHVDSDSYQRVAVVGYLIRHRNGETWRAPLIPELFFGENGQQLDTWSQYLTAGDHTVLRRDSGNPHLPDSELNWTRVGVAPQRQPTPTPQPTAQPAALDLNSTLLLVVVGGLAVIGLYYMVRK